MTLQNHKISLRPGETAHIKIELKDDEGLYQVAEIVEVAHLPADEKLLTITHFDPVEGTHFLIYLKEPTPLK